MLQRDRSVLRRARIALACATVSATAALSATAAAESAEDDELDARLDRLGDELDEEFADWGEVEQVIAEPDPEEPPRVDPREDLPPATYDATTWPSADLDRPLGLGPGMFELRTTLAADLSDGEAFRTVSFAPDLYYGVTERLSIGVVHTHFATLTPEPDEVSPAGLGAHAPTAPVVQPGDGLCLGDGCARVYDNAGVDVRLALGAMRGRIQLRAHAGMEAANFDPLRLGGRVGLTGRIRAGPAALLVDASVRVGLLRREVGNDDVLSLPVALVLQATPSIVVELASGVYGPLTEVRAGARVPATLGLLYAVSSALDLGASVGFPALLGGDAAPGGSARAATSFAAYRW